MKLITLVFLAGLTFGSIAKATTPEPTLPWKMTTQGSVHVCGIDQSDRAWCWGNNLYGAVGTAPGSYKNPTLVIGERAYQDIQAGKNATYALDFYGRVWIWGTIFCEGSCTTYFNPAMASGASTFTSIFAGPDSVCALNAKGEAWCLGEGPLGDGKIDSSVEFVQILTPISFKKFALGSNYSCALDSNSEAWCWGTHLKDCAWSGGGPCGKDLVPLKMSGGLRFSELSSGTQSTCGIALDGKTYCWGMISKTPQDTASDAPVELAGNHHFHSIAVAHVKACALEADQSLWCWDDETAPTKVGGNHSYQKLNSDQSMGFCGIDTAGLVWCRGYNFYSPYEGVPVSYWSRQTEPLLSWTTGPALFTQTAAGNDHACGLDQAGKAWCWGYGAYLGQQQEKSSGSPIPVEGEHQFRRIYVGGWSGDCTCGVDAADRTWCWGIGVMGTTPSPLDEIPESDRYVCL